MNRVLKTLVVAAAASFAFSCGVAASAQAVEFHAAEAHTLVNASQSTTHEFTAGAGAAGIVCTTATFAGTSSSSTATELLIAPHYTDCKDTFGRVADVFINGCEYRFHATAGSGTTYTGNADIVGCNEGKLIEITITAGGLLGDCTVTIGEQNGIAPLTFHNVANGDVKVDASATNIVNTTHGGVFNCGIANGVHTGGTYNGDSTVVGTSTAGAPVNIFVG